MFQNAINFLLSCISFGFDMLDRLLDALPGAWVTLFTFIVILVIQRFLLKPLGFGSASDTVSKIKRGRSDKVWTKDSSQQSGG